MPYAKYTPDEVDSRGEELYQQQLREKLEDQCHGQFVVIDIETGEYEIDADDLQATKRALRKRPDAVLYGVRIGSRAAYNLGGHVEIQDE